MCRKLTPKQEEALGRAILPILQGIRPTREEVNAQTLAGYAAARAEHMATRANHDGCVICEMDPQIETPDKPEASYNPFDHDEEPPEQTSWSVSVRRTPKP